MKQVLKILLIAIFTIFFIALPFLINSLDSYKITTTANRNPAEMITRVSACATAYRVSRRLKERFNERVVATGIYTMGQETYVFEFWLNEISETWTFTIRNASGEMCVIYSGFAGELVNKEL